MQIARTTKAGIVLTPGCIYQVCRNWAPFHKGRWGRLLFFGGPNYDVAVLQDETDATVMFAVDPEHLT